MSYIRPTLHDAHLSPLLQSLLLSFLFFWRRIAVKVELQWWGIVKGSSCSPEKEITQTTAKQQILDMCGKHFHFTKFSVMQRCVLVQLWRSKKSVTAVNLNGTMTSVLTVSKYLLTYCMHGWSDRLQTFKAKLCGEAACNSIWNKPYGIKPMRPWYWFLNAHVDWFQSAKLNWNALL